MAEHDLATPILLMARCEPEPRPWNWKVVARDRRTVADGEGFATAPECGLAIATDGVAALLRHEGAADE